MIQLPRARMFTGFLLVAAALTGARATADETPWVVYPGGDGPGKGKNIVFVSGDEEYRSEEALPQLAKILALRHGFTCTVLFAIDPKDGTINPNETHNIPGLEALQKADLMVIFTRFRDLPDEQMKYVADYIDAGKPVVGLRTATHAFATSKGEYTRFNWGNKNKEWDGGFGRHVLGETWINHWGRHGQQSTRGLVARGQEDNPILRGVKDGDVWGPTDVYEVRVPAHEAGQAIDPAAWPEGTPLIFGQVLEGMKPDDKPIDGPKNDPMMPVAWTRAYTGASADKTGRAFTTTMGAATDLQTEGVRRMLVNACYWAVGLEDKIPAKSDVGLVGDYKPLPFKFGGFQKGVKPSDLEIKDLQRLPK